MNRCKHCGEDIALRNPSGFCDHLYYPDNCEICKKAEGEPDPATEERDRILALIEEEKKGVLELFPDAQIEPTEEYAILVEKKDMYNLALDTLIKKIRNE